MKKVNQFLSVFSGELFSYFNSPIAYIFIVVFVTFLNGLFMTNFFLIGNADMRYFFWMLPIVLCIFIPSITMRIWAEEKRGNTFELLLTFPMNTFKLVLGKFTAGFAFYLIALLGTIFVPIMLLAVGKPDIGQIFTGYIGALFVGAFFLSVGIFISGLCKDQIIAFIVSMIVCFFFYLTGLDLIASLIDGWIPGIGSFLKTNFGMTQHFAGFQKGIIATRDVIYFIVMIGVFLTLNYFSIEDRMRPKAKLLFSIAVAISIVICMIFNYLVMDIPLGRFDLTKDKLYTVTDSTQKILKSLKAPVAVKLYISPQEKMPTSFKTLEQDIKDKLEEIKILSKEKLDYKIFHMEVTQDKEENKTDSLDERLQRSGIEPFQVQNIEEDQVGIKLIYSAISIAYKDKEEKIIARITPDTLYNLEYELISKIFRMTLPKRPTVALIAPFEEKSVDPKLMSLLRQLGQSPDALGSQLKDDKYRLLDALLQYEDYDLRRVKLTKDDPLPDDLDTLIVVAPENLQERQLYEITKFLHEGGNVIIAAQQYEYDYRSEGRGITIMPRKINHGLDKLFKSYGVGLNSEFLMDDEHEVLSISGGMSFGPFSRSMPVKAPMQIKVNQSSMNQDVSITGRLSSIFYLWGSSLDLDKDKLNELNLKDTVLFSSSSKSWTVPYHSGAISRRDFEKYGNYHSSPLAVMVEGQFPNVFESSDLVPKWQKKLDFSNPQMPQEPVKEEKDEVIPVMNPKQGKLILIGCSKMFEENIIKEGGAINLFSNSVDALTLGDDLINIRSRGPINRKISKLNKLQKLWYRFLTIILIPILVICFGTVRSFLRRKEKEQYLKFIS